MLHQFSFKNVIDNQDKQSYDEIKLNVKKLYLIKPNTLHWMSMIAIYIEEGRSSRAVSSQNCYKNM